MSVVDALAFAIWVLSQSVRGRAPFEYSFLASTTGVIVLLSLAFILLVSKGRAPPVPGLSLTDIDTGHNDVGKTGNEPSPDLPMSLVPE